MKKNIFISILAAFSILTACSERPDIVFPDGGMTITALTELPDSKTTVVSETQVYWEPGDEITVFSGDMQGRFVTDITEPAAIATFKGMLYGEPDETLWAVYPYSKDATFDGETITTVLPSVQTARAGTFGKNMNLTVAKSSNSTLQFYNVGGGVRFSVSEEGIKKVIFEGLNGEILSGKVKIGFENGLPKVQEVTAGSPFITLLPPEGETFQTGKWYFMVAIPGALENGYKMRFYKDEDYARRISENAVTIKRSIYGTVASADAEIEYESITTNFPETEEEWEESIELTEQIGDEVLSIIKENEKDDVGVDLVVSLAKTVDNVLDARMNSDNNVVMVLQKDSVWINVLLNDIQSTEGNTNSQPFFSNASADTKSIGSKNNSGKKAIMLFPFYDSFYEELDYLKESLDYAGIDYSNHIYMNSEASIDLFDGDNLDDYDLIYIHTHGANGYSLKHSGTLIDTEVPDLLCLISGTKYSKSVLKDFIKQGKLRWEEASVFKSTEGTYFAITPDYLNNAKFNNTCVIIGACMSMMQINGYRYMANKFLTKGAGAYSGFEDEINTYLSPYLNSRLIEFLCHGFSFQDAFNYWKNAQWTSNICQTLWKIFEDTTPIQPSLWSFLVNAQIKDKPFFLVNDAVINLGTIEEKEGNIILPWTCGLSDFQHTQQASCYGVAPFLDETINITVDYDIYIDDMYVSSSDSKSVIWNHPTPGYHNWFVQANLKVEGNVVASYQSAVGQFTVEQAGDAIMEYSQDVELGMVKMGQSTTKSVTIKNIGDAPLVISEIGGYDPSIISVEWTSATIAPGDSKPLAITLKQPTPGDGHHFVYIWSNAKNYEDTYSYLFITWCGQRATPAYSTQMVDLGLSVKWATCDLGSDSPYEYGELYAWGETDRKSSYTWDNYKWGRATSLTKYNKSDNLMTLQKSDDAAYVHLRGLWRMPTMNECQELIDNCNWRATTVNNIDVFEGTSKINGKKIYFKRRVNTVGQLYVLWTKDLWYDEIAHIFTLNYYDFDSDECVLEASVGQNRSNGYYIRPVYGEESTPVHDFSVSPSSFYFGEVNVGQSSERRVFTFNNDGDADVEFWVESCPDGFIYPDGMHGGTHSRVPAHSSRSGFWIRFDPTQAKNYSGTVVLRTNDPEFPVVRINVSGKGVRSGSGGGEPRMSLSSDSYDFGTVSVNTNKKTSFTITNTGTADLDITTIRLVDGNKGFYLANTTKTGSVPPGGTYTINVMFRPTKKGTFNEQIFVKTNATNKSYTMIYLSGTGQ